MSGFHPATVFYHPQGRTEVSVCLNFLGLGLRVMVVNATFNDISVISCRSALLIEETGVS
jgi:hypothetical protein